MGVLDAPAVSASAFSALAGQLAATYNIGPATTRKARIPLAKVRANRGSMKLACLGDSTTWGQGSDAATGFRASRTSYPALLAPILNSYYAPTAATFASPPSKNDVNATDSRWAPGAGWALSFAGLGQMASYQAPSAVTTTLTYTPDGLNVDTFDIYYVRNSGFGSFTASIDGGAGTVVNTAGTGAVLKQTLTVAAGSSHVLSIVPNGAGSVYIVGVDTYLSTANQIRVANMGVSSSRAADWNTTSSGGALQTLAAYAPDLTLVMLGVNDSKGPRTVAQFTTDLTAIVQRAQLSGDVILLSPVPSQTTGTVGTADYAYEAQYRDAMKSNAVSLGVGYINIYDRFGSYALANAAGWMSDANHPTTFGYADLCSAIFSALRVL